MEKNSFHFLKICYWGKVQLVWKTCHLPLIVWIKSLQYSNTVYRVCVALYIFFLYFALLHFAHIWTQASQPCNYLPFISRALYSSPPLHHSSLSSLVCALRASCGIRNKMSLFCSKWHLSRRSGLFLWEMWLRFKAMWCSFSLSQCIQIELMWVSKLRQTCSVRTVRFSCTGVRMEQL